MTIESYEENVVVDNPINRLNRLLVKYDLTPNQAKVYLYLSKMGIKTASEISKSLLIPRTETYHLLSTLQQKKIVFSMFGKPTKFKANSIDESIVILVNNEKERIKQLETQKDNVIKLWKIIPMYNSSKDKSDDKFKTLQGINQISIKLDQMIHESSKKILVLGTESNFKEFYRTGFTEELKKTKAELRILTDQCNKGITVFEDISYKKIKKLDDKNREEFCFVITDGSEVIFFINNPKLNDMMAIWTNSKKFITTLKSLFSLIWKKSRYINESDVELLSRPEITYKHRLREIEQEKAILNYLQNNFKISKNTF